MRGAADAPARGRRLKLSRGQMSFQQVALCFPTPSPAPIFACTVQLVTNSPRLPTAESMADGPPAQHKRGREQMEDEACCVCLKNEARLDQIECGHVVLCATCSSRILINVRSLGLSLLTATAAARSPLHQPVP